MITIGDSKKSYSDFKEQLSDDPDMKTLGIQYAQASETQKNYILDKVSEVMFDYPIEYIKQAQLFIQMYASFANVFLEFKRLKKEMDHEEFEN